MSASTRRTRRGLRAFLGLFFAFYCLAVRPASAALAASADAASAARRGIAISVPARAHASLAPATGAAAFHAVRLDARYFGRHHRTRRHAAALASAAPTLVAASAPPPAAACPASVCRRAGAPEYPPSALS